MQSACRGPSPGSLTGFWQPFDAPEVPWPPVAGSRSARPRRWRAVPEHELAGTVLAMRALRADEADIPGWLDLAAEVEDVFGSPMSADPTFERILERHVADGTGFVVRESPATPGAAVIGAAMWLPQRRRIGWLAVAERYRRTGVGSCLLDAIIEVA